MEQRLFTDLAESVALKHVLIHVARVAYSGAGYSLDQVKATHAAMLEILRNETFPGADAATSDHLAGEILTASERLLAAIEEGLKEASTPQGGGD